MKILMMFVLCSVLLYANWEDDIAGIKTDISNIKGNVNYLRNNELNIIDKEFYWSNVELGLWQGAYDWSSNSADGVHNIQFDWPGNYEDFFKERLSLNDNTSLYDSYIQSYMRNTTEPDLSAFHWRQGEEFFQYSKTANILTSVSNRVQDLNNNQEMMRNSTTTMVEAESVVNNVASTLKAKLNTTYEDYTFFTLDLSGLGNIFGSTVQDGVTVPSNYFSNWVFKCNMVPDENKNPHLYKLWLSYKVFYTNYHGQAIIIVCAYIYVIMLFWNKLLSVFNFE